MAKIRGECLCGTVRYRSDAEPLMTVICNCKSCQRSTGTAFSVLVAVPRGSLIMEGSQPGVYANVGSSGQPVSRKFCSNSGSPIYTEVASPRAMDLINAGTLDDTSWVQPQVNIWCDSAQPWVQMHDAIPRVPRNPTAA